MSGLSHAYRLATALPHGGWQWSLKRNCSITPVQMCTVLGTLALLSFAVAAFFWVNGATLVLPFALIEVVALAVALVVFARHAADTERISLDGPELRVEWEQGGRVETAAFSREWVRVEPVDGDGSLLRVFGQGREVLVGRHIRPDLRPLLAREIKHALRGA